MDQDRTSALLAKYLAGELSPEEAEELEWACLANPVLRVTLNVLQRMRELPPRSVSFAEEQEMMERGLQRLHADMEHTPVNLYATSTDALYQEGGGRLRRMSSRWWMAAAAVAVMGVAGVLLYHGNKQEVAVVAPPMQDKEIATRYGTRIFQELPDGSKLWLNAGSKVKYASNFSHGRRELTLSGEAFFDVKHDPEHPFIIHTGKLDVRVLGTSFNIKAYPNDSTVETTLIKGKVEIDFQNNPKANIVLVPNEKVVIRDSSTAGTGVHFKRRMVAPDSMYRTLIETSWVEDKLVFRNEPFSEVSMKLERWYNIHFNFQNNSYLPYRLTGYFKDQPINTVMDALRISLGFHYRIEGDTIYIR